MSAVPDWREMIASGFKSLELAETYADDGTFLSAARCADQAATHFRNGHAARATAIEAAMTAKAGA